MFGNSTIINARFRMYLSHEAGSKSKKPEKYLCGLYFLLYGKHLTLPTVKWQNNFFQDTSAEEVVDPWAIPPMVASLPVAASLHVATTHPAVTIAAPLPLEAMAADPVTVAVDPVVTAADPVVVAADLVVTVADPVATTAATAEDPVALAALLVTTRGATVTPLVADAALPIWPLAATVGGQSVASNSPTTVSEAMTEGMK
jgi:hypothetical protein